MKLVVGRWIAPVTARQAATPKGITEKRQTTAERNYQRPKGQLFLLFHVGTAAGVELVGI